MVYNLIRNGFELVERADTFEAATRLMLQYAVVSEAMLRDRYPSRQIRISRNRDSIYVDAMAENDVFQREFYLVEEACS